MSRDWLNAATSEYDETYEREAMEWMQQAAFDRGSFAILLGVVCSSESRGVRAIAVGDSLLAIIDGDHVVRTIPYLEPDEFDHAPRLLSTSRFENRTLDDKSICEAWHDLDVSSHTTPNLLLMTDAIGRWLLEQPDSDRVSTLLGIRDAEAFARFVEHERTEGRLRRDDSTLVVLR